MSDRRWSIGAGVGVVTAAAVVAIAACGASGGARGLGTATAPDTARGVVALVGSDPRATLIVTPANGSADDVVAPRGADVALLRQLTGLEVVLLGRRSDDYVIDAGPRGARAFDVEGFLVRAADGVPATDGVLGEEGGRYFLTIADGARVPITMLPPALVSQLGARVYLVGPPGVAPAAYGIIRAVAPPPDRAATRAAPAASRTGSR